MRQLSPAAQLECLKPPKPLALPVQARGAGTPTDDTHQVAAEGLRGPAATLPHRDAIQRSFGDSHPVDSVRAHVGGAAADAARALGAEAFASGESVGFRRAPDLHTAAHEAAHVVQQRAGVDLPGGEGRAGDRYERHADAVADRVVSGGSAASLLDTIGANGTPPTVQRLVQFKGPNYKDWDELKKLSLSGLSAYARGQVDWHSGLADEDERVQVRSILGFLRETSANGAACAGFNTETFWTEVKNSGGDGLDAGKADALRAYSRGVKQPKPTWDLDLTKDVAEAIKWGKVVLGLEKSSFMSGAMLHTIAGMRETELMADDDALLQGFVKFADTCEPTLHADDGWEVESYRLHVAEGYDPTDYKGTNVADRVRNYHRFERDALKKVVENYGKTGSGDPLTVILHSTFDSTGAFHRDEALTNLIETAGMKTLLLEGFGDLSSLMDEVKQLAKDYGQKDPKSGEGKIDQVMIAGHGNTRSVELTGSLKEVKGRMKQDEEEGELNLDSNKDNTEAFLGELLDLMVSSPDKSKGQHARLVFNACLTGSSETEGRTFSSDVKTAQDEIHKDLANNPSIAARVNQMASDKGIDVKAIGANASTKQSKGASFVGKDNELDLVDTNDPELTSPKIKYVEFGTEPTGVLRSVVQAWADDPAKCLEAIERRNTSGKPASTGWDDVFIFTLLQFILDKYRDDATGVRNVAEIAERVSSCHDESKCRPRKLDKAGLYDGENKDLLVPLIGGLSASTEWKANNFIPLVFYQAWAWQNSIIYFAFTGLLGSFTVKTAEDYVWLGALKQDVLPMDSAAAATPGQLVLALMVLLEKDSNYIKDYLKAYLNGATKFPDSLNLEENILGGAATEADVLKKLGLATGGKGGPAPNYDLDGDGKNDTYLEPLTFEGAVRWEHVPVYEKPDKTSNQLHDYKKGSTFHVIGKLDEWYAIEHGDATAFALVKHVKKAKS